MPGIVVRVEVPLAVAELARPGVGGVAQMGRDRIGSRRVLLGAAPSAVDAEFDFGARAR